MQVNIKPGISRIVGIALGVLMMLAGASCFAAPVRTYGAFGYIAAVAMVVDGVAKGLLYLDEKNVGIKDVFTLVSGICSVVLGIVLLGSRAAMGNAEVMVAYMVGFWTLVVGSVRIVRSFQMRSVQKALDEHRVGSNWDVALITGLLLVVLGLFGIANPLLVVIIIAWQVGAALMMAGIGLITATA